jgi:dihydropteroate synthase
VVKLVGILNVTPDSFSDGGKFSNLSSAINQTTLLIKDGADIIDVGAESTRPGAIRVNEEEEWNRLKGILPSIINISHNNNIQVSLDSRHHSVVAKALELGIDIINDVTGFEDDNMAKLAAKSNKKIVVMHNLGAPAKKSEVIDENLDEIRVIKEWAKDKINYLRKLGVKRENIIFDPCIGFGKNSKQSINILGNIRAFDDLEVEIYIGHSRKGFLKEFPFANDVNKEDKDLQTLIISRDLVKLGVSYLRVHNVSIHAQIKTATNI